MTLTPAGPPNSVLDALRHGDRPGRDAQAAARWRAQLELVLGDALGPTMPDLPVVVSAATLGRRADVLDLHDSARARLRGALVSVLARLHAVGTPVGDAYEDAVAAWSAEVPAPGLRACFDALDADGRARLATEVTAHYVTLSRALGALPPAWPVRTAQRTSLRLAAGRVLVRDSVDLVLGASDADSTSVVLVDVTTSPLGENAERALRFHALVETVRAGEAPWRSAILSTATGELWQRDLDDELLARALEDLVASVYAEWRAA